MGQADPGGRLIQPIEMLVEREQPPVVDADNLVEAVGELVAAVFGIDAGGTAGHYFAIKPDLFAHLTFRGG